MLKFEFTCDELRLLNQALVELSYEDKKVLAMLNGKRDFFRGKPIYTNLCSHREPAVLTGSVYFRSRYRLL